MNLAVYLADQNPHRDRTLGITSYTDCLLSGLSQRGDIHLTTIVSASSYAFKSPRSSEVRLPWRTDNGLGRLWTDNFGPLLTPSLKTDIYFYPKGYASYLMRPFCPVIGTVHDAILQYYADHYPGYRSRLNMCYWLGLMKASLRKFNLVLAVSQTTQQQIIEFCERHRIKKPEIKVTYEASDYEEVEPKSGFKEDYIIHFASDAPHKGTRRLLEFWKVHERKAAQWPPLKLIGRKSRLLDEFLKCPNVSHASCSSRNDLSRLLAGARALLLPSEIEGFGLPALEAYYHGSPVCYAGATSVEEILAPFTSKGAFSLNDPDSFGGAMREVLNMPFNEILMVRDGLRKKFSKRNFIDSVAQACHQLCPNIKR